MKKKAPAKSLAVEVVNDKETKCAIIADFKNLAEEAIQHHLAGGVTIARGLAHSILCGKALSELKQRLGHGKWLPFIKEHLEPAGMPERTCRYHMQVWDAAKRKAIKSANAADLERLMDKHLSELTTEERATLLSVATETCKGTSATQLLNEYGIIKDPALKGGKRESKKTKLTPEQEYEAQVKVLREDCQNAGKRLQNLAHTKAYRILNDAELEGLMDLAQALLDSAREWHNTPKSERAANLLPNK